MARRPSKPGIHQAPKESPMANPRKDLEALLASLGESSQFVSSGSLPPVLPGLEATGVGEIGSPITAVDAKRLIS